MRQCRFFTTPCFTAFWLTALLLLAALVGAGGAAQDSPQPVNWRTDWEAARQEAKYSGKRLFVVFQCAREKGDGLLDGQILRPNDPELARLLARRFVPVRFSSIKDVDLRTFRFDYDLTFAALVMDAEGRTLARWGTRDADSPTARLSLDSLKEMLRSVLALSPAAASAFPLPPRPPFTLTDYPEFARSKRAQEPCFHCHYASDARFAQLRKDGLFRKAQLFAYPLPENIGITLDTKENNRVRVIVPQSPAALAGIRPGDVIRKINDTRTFSSADLQFALNTVLDPGAVTLYLARHGKPLPRPMMLRLPAGWRATDISWRPSQGNIPPILGTWETPLTLEEKKALGIPPSRMALRVTFLFDSKKWKKTYGDLKKNDIIVGVNFALLPTMTPQQFHSYYRLRCNVGDTATLHVIRGKQRKNIRVPCTDATLE